MGENLKPVIVVSAVNLFEGGPLSILKDCLLNLTKYYSEKYAIIALLHDKNLIDFPEIQILEFAKARRSYLYRLYYEYFFFNKLSKKLNPYLWISLHDITPNVRSKKQVVYCHNPAPFYQAKISDIYFEPTVFFFSLFYKYLYRINIHKNNFVIVQQNWIKDKFHELFKINNIIIASPFVNVYSNDKKVKIDSSDYCFFFPTLSRVFKNIEVIGEAVKVLRKRSISGFKIMLTINGTESRYTKYIFRKYSRFSEIEFRGILTRNEVFEQYMRTDCLIFPSKLETWGLPLSEFKTFDKPIMVSDLPYGHETIGDYSHVCFFNPDSPNELASLMQSAINGDNSIFTSNKIVPPRPDATNWKELLDILIS